MEKTKSKVAVTGAAGLVGNHLVARLAKEGFTVRAVVRSLPSTDNLRKEWQKLGVEIVAANVLELDRLQEAFFGIDVVIHAAAQIDPYGERARIFAVNVDGTKNALSAARRQGVKQFIYVSSLSVITGNKDQYATPDDAPYVPSNESYAASKIEAEKYVLSSAPETLPRVTVIRPGFIYGPGERSWLPRLIDSIASGKAMLIDNGLKETNVVYVENVSSAILAAIDNEKTYGEAYNLTDGPGISKKMLFDTLASRLSLPPVTRVVPGVVARSFCEAISMVAPYLPEETSRKLARYSRAAFRLAGLNQGYSIAKAERDLNYGQRISFEEGMGSTLANIKGTRSLASVAQK